VAAAIRERIKNLNGGFGFSSAACGSDILFLEAMLAAGGEITVVLPYEREQFITDSVEIAHALSWRQRFENVLQRAARVLTASPQRLAIGGVSYDYANQMLLGLATIRARQLETGLTPLAVWDGLASDGPGGTESAVRRWEKLKLPPEIIDLSRMRSPAKRIVAPKIRRARKSRGAIGSQIMAMLFADAVGFSKLSEAEVPRFVHHFLGAVGRLIARPSAHVVSRNTWGDGLYLVFSSAERATSFALDLRDLIARTDWTKHGLPADLNLRIGLHAGPVYESKDPITHTRTYFGSHVSRAARIEPITPPGQVYASEAMAALASAQPQSDFTFEYAGQIPTAKNYGTFPMYHVRRT
jgi:class 3 adenylate cyclase